MIKGIGDASDWIGTTTALQRIGNQTCTFTVDDSSSTFVGLEPKHLSDAIYDSCGNTKGILATFCELPSFLCWFCIGDAQVT